MSQCRLVAAVILLLVGATARCATIGGHLARSSDGTPIAGATVDAFRTSDFENVAEQATLADGSYALSLPADSYLIVAAANGFIAELYDNLPCPPCDVDQATTITVAAAEFRGDVDFALDKALTKSGTCLASTTNSTVRTT